MRLYARDLGQKYAASILVAVADAIPIINTCGSTSYHKMMLLGSNGPVRFMEVFTLVQIEHSSVHIRIVFDLQ